MLHLQEHLTNYSLFMMINIRPFLLLINFICFINSMSLQDSFQDNKLIKDVNIQVIHLLGSFMMMVLSKYHHSLISNLYRFKKSIYSKIKI